MKALAGKAGKPNDAMRKSTARFVQEPKAELQPRETNYKYAKPSS